MDAAKPRWTDSALFNLLVLTTGRRQRWPYKLFWNRLYEHTRGWARPVNARLHGRRVRLSFNYTYPIFSRRFPNLNAPLLELVHQAYLALGRPVRLVDIGAAVGDTVLLVEANCPGMVREYVCVDGDPEFYGYLVHNVRHLPRCTTILHQLSRARRTERALIRIHGGTASAQGEQRVESAPLDDLLEARAAGPIDVVKIDVDGFDGEVLTGAQRLLQRDRPAVIFEWHPRLCDAAGTDPFQAFAALACAGYSRLVWFTKYGEFSHYGNTSDREVHERLCRHCRQTRAEADWHYDVVAWHEDRPIDEQALADLMNARRRVSHH